MTIGTFMRSVGAIVAASATKAANYIGAGSGASKLRRWWLDRDKSRRALAALDDDELGNLSDLGRQIRREARQARERS
jgi:hypothetical protein